VRVRDSRHQACLRIASRVYSRERCGASARDSHRAASDSVLARTRMGAPGQHVFWFLSNPYAAFKAGLSGNIRSHRFLSLQST